ncbi:MAG: hypothetical protein E4H20_03865 [Spirochaetales bacterium]|nr:MAG: hypothetical protein E4H20_03865 [Spirochaetales bacterium]
MQKLVVSFSIIVISLVSGYVFNATIIKGLVRINMASAETMRRGMQKIALLVVNPVAFCSAVWVIDLSERRYFILPVIGIAALATGLGLGFFGSRLQRLPPGRAGVYVTCASFTNIGNIGGLFVFLLLGESAFALIPFYKLFEELWYYSILFPLARSYGARSSPGLTGVKANSGMPAGALRVLRDPFLLVALCAVALGLGLNAGGIARPVFFGRLNSALVPLSSFLLLFAIGMRMRFRIARPDRLAAFLLILGKALVAPAIVTVLAVFAGLNETAGGLGLKVVLVLSAMPVGFLGLVPPALYNLDQDFAGSLWLASNAALLLIVPALFILLPGVTGS